MQANVLEWLEDSSRRFGNKLAICDDREEMTYLQYHQKAIGLAGRNGVLCGNMI